MTHRRLWTALGALLLIAIAAVGIGWYALFREVPQRIDPDTPEEQFKYGSIGAEDDQGMPFWIWLVLPKMFPEYLPAPGGWASFGFAWEPGRPMPVGFSRKTIGFDRVAINCALCHTGRVRKPGEVVTRIYPAGPGNTVAPLAYQRFLFAAASDPRFTASNVLHEIDEVTHLSAFDRLLYRVLIPQVRSRLLAQKETFAWTDHRPDWGRGRIDPFNPIKFGILRPLMYGSKPLAQFDDGTIGNSDMEPIWNLEPRVAHKMVFHWDGLNTDLREVVLSSALGDGATPKSLNGVLDHLDRLQKWLEKLPPPKFEELFPIDHELARSGEGIYRQSCAQCHAMEGAKTGRLLPLTDEAWSDGVDPAAPRPRFTDPHRAAMWTPEAATAYNTYGKPWGFAHFQSKNSYVNVPLDAIWIRAPYLHNGSVPYLGELLEPPEKRTKVFYRGYELYDPARMGYVSDGEDAQRAGSRYDTSEAGNSNQGHLWGIQLSAEQKRALLEYLKTL